MSCLGFSQGIKKVVIDAGHGGHDPGCHGAKSKEKEVCLAMALKLGKLIQESYKDVQVIYTRDTDVFVELHERANIANKNKADLFICIHANAGQKTASGSETYVMGLHKTDDNLNVAKRENSVILMENDYNAVYEGFNPNSDEDIIALTLMQSAYLDQSVDIASKIQGQFEKIGRKNRGVKQAGFLVLYKTAMPSILIETGFLTNQEEEAFLADVRNQDKMAQSMFNAFKQYKEGIDKRISPNSTTVKPKTIVDQTISTEIKPEKEIPQPKIEQIKQGIDTVYTRNTSPPKDDGRYYKTGTKACCYRCFRYHNNKKA
jgi:N-acetylmuramoyl-L-alanine amidase